MKKLKARIGMRLCDFGLWVLSLGPKDHQDRQAERELVEHWRKFRANAI